VFGVLRSPIFPVILLIVGITFSYLGYKDAKMFAALRDHGVRVEADITGLEWEESKRTHEVRGFTAKIEFTTNDGEKINSETWITEAFARDLKSGKAAPVVDVDYLPESPKTFRDTSKSDDSDGEKAFGHFMLLASVVIFALRHFLKK
jgi:hypothetical protein